MAIQSSGRGRFEVEVEGEGEGEQQVLGSRELQLSDPSRPYDSSWSGDGASKAVFFTRHGRPSRPETSPPTPDTGHRLEPLRFLICDRDGKHSHAFDSVFHADDLHIITSAPQAPRMNAHCERVPGTIGRELLHHILILGEAHARQVLTTYADHYNRHRPHQARDQLPPEAQQHPTAVHDLNTRKLHRTRILGGLVNEYRQAA
jgi:hypothetical protein